MIKSHKFMLIVQETCCFTGAALVPPARGREGSSRWVWPVTICKGTAIIYDATARVEDIEGDNIWKCCMQGGPGVWAGDPREGGGGDGEFIKRVRDITWCCHIFSVRTYIHITWLHTYYKYFFRILYSSVVPFIHDTEDVRIHILHTLLIVSNIFPSTLSCV